VGNESVSRKLMWPLPNNFGRNAANTINDMYQFSDTEFTLV
jgi:hypothetical protein